MSACNNSSIQKDNLNNKDTLERKSKIIPTQNNITDSTNFDNFKPINPLSENEINLLKLEQLDFPAENYYFRYDLDISTQFNTKVISATTEMEIKTYLITYDFNNIMLDKIEIAYDEIAESALRAESIIEGNKLIKTEFNYFSESPEVSKSEYEINSEGKIIKK